MAVSTALMRRFTYLLVNVLWFSAICFSAGADHQQASSSASLTLTRPGEAPTDTLASDLLSSTTSRFSGPDANDLNSALSCASALSDWSTNAFWHTQFQKNKTHPSVTRTLPARTYTVPSYSATDTTRLCDGHPRVIGTKKARMGNDTITHDVSTTTFMQTRLVPYATPRPDCTIDVEDCVTLASLYHSIVSPVQVSPVCNTTYYEPTVAPSGYAPAPSAFGQGAASSACDQCTIVVSAARLLYWPVQTSGSADLCSDGILWHPNTNIIPGTRTGQGPNKFTTAGVVITSPSVAIQLTGISRLDGCYSTVSDSIIPIPPGDLTSIIGVKATTSTYNLLPFNVADLNYYCLGPNGTVYVAGGPGKSCWPAVPASAYFRASSTWRWYSDLPATMQSALTIADDYRPDISIPSQLYKWARTLWGPNCIVSKCGVWDPPVPCAPVSSFPGATVPNQVTTTTQITPSTGTPLPAEQPQIASQPTETASPESPSASASMAPVYSPLSIAPSTATDQTNSASASPNVPSVSSESTASSTDINTQDPSFPGTTSAVQSVTATDEQPANSPLNTPATSSGSNSATVSNSDPTSGASAPYHQDLDLPPTGSSVAGSTASAMTMGIACHILGIFGGSCVRTTATTQVTSPSGAAAVNAGDPASSTTSSGTQSGPSTYDPLGLTSTAESTTEVTDSTSDDPTSSHDPGNDPSAPASYGLSNPQAFSALMTTSPYISSPTGYATGDPPSGPSAQPPSLIDIPSGASLLTIDSQSYLEQVSIISVTVLQNDHTTITMPSAGNIVTIGTQQVAADQFGNLIVGVGSAASTITGAPKSASASSASEDPMSPTLGSSSPRTSDDYSAMLDPTTSAAVVMTSTSDPSGSTASSTTGSTRVASQGSVNAPWFTFFTTASFVASVIYLLAT